MYPKKISITVPVKIVEGRLQKCGFNFYNYCAPDGGCILFFQCKYFSSDISSCDLYLQFIRF